MPSSRPTPPQAARRKLEELGRSLDGVIGRLSRPRPAPGRVAAGSPDPARLARGAKRLGLLGRGVGLALGSGGARGFAHLGVLRALREAGVRPACIAGTSMGAVVGAFAAAGKEKELEAYVLSLDWPHIVRYGDVVWPLKNGGLLKGNVFRRELARRLGDASFASLPLPFAAVATDVERGERVVMKEGDLSLAVRASSSIPGLFAPVRHDDRWLIDGAFTDPVPVAEARDLGAKKVFAVDVSPEVARATAGTGRPGIGEILLQAMSIAEAGLARHRPDGKEEADWLLRPPVGHFPTLAFDRAEEIVEAGYRAATAFLLENA